MSEQAGSDTSPIHTLEADAYTQLSDPVFTLDGDQRLTSFNEQAEHVLGGGQGLLGTDLQDVFPDAIGLDTERPTLRRAVERALEHGEPATLEVFVTTSDTWFEVRVYPTEDGVWVHLRDVSDRKQREQALTTQQARHQAITESATDAIVTIDSDSRIQFANSAIEDIFGYTPEELLGEPLTLLMPEQLRNQHTEAVAQYLETGQRQLDWGDIQLPGRHKNGDELDLSVSFSSFEQDGHQQFTGIIRDITERKTRERSLRRAYEIVSDPDKSFDDKVTDLLWTVRDVVGTDYATLSHVHGEEYVFETLVAPNDADIEAGDSVPLQATNCDRVVATEKTLVLQDVAADAPELADRTGNAEWGISCYLGAPVTVGEEVYGTFCFYDMEARTEEFSDWEVTFVDLLSDWVSSELERQRYIDRLGALDELNRIVRDITDAAFSHSTREEIEAIACERLAAADSYQFAWIGEADPATQSVELRTEAGVENYLEDASISLDPTNDESLGPTGRAFRTGELQTTQNTQTDPLYEPWHDVAAEYGFRSSAAVPIKHDGTVYGVLNVYAERTDAFEGEEGSLIEHLGETLGHAIAAVGRKRALTSDTVIELEFRVRDALAEWGVSEQLDGALTFNESVPVGDDTYVVYGVASESVIDTMVDVVDDVDRWDEITPIGEHDDGVAFELRVSEQTIISMVASLGGAIERAVIDDGDYHATVHLPQGSDVRQVLDAVRDVYPGAEMVSKQQMTRTDDTSGRIQQVLTDELTGRQQASLRAAYAAGYFAWPRNASAEDVAEHLDVSAPTFHEHLRTAEQKLLDALLAGKDEE